MTQGFDPSRASQETAIRAFELSRRRHASQTKGRRRRHWFLRLIGFLLVLAILAIFAVVVIAVVSAHGLHP
jgi:hypothetical protein